MQEALTTNTARATVAIMPRQADSDDDLISLWLHGRSEHTKSAYASDAMRFQSFASKPLEFVTLRDIHLFVDSLVDLAATSQARTISAVKSLLSFARRVGYLSFDIGAAVAIPKTRNRLSERILTESQVIAMIALETNERNRAILRCLYIGGLRVSELAGLRWRDLQARGATEGQIDVFGKGSKTRSVLAPAALWQELQALRGDATDDDPVFVSRSKGGHLDRSQIMRVVRAAGRRAGIKANVSAHWLRHCHASHSLDRGAPISLVASTLGHASVSTTGRYLHARPNESSSRFLAG